MPHVSFTLAVQNLEGLIRVHFHSVVSDWILPESVIPVVLDLDQELGVSSVVCGFNQDGPVVVVEALSVVDEICVGGLVLVDLEVKGQELAIFPAGARDLRLVVGVDGEVEISLYRRNSHFELGQLAIVTFSVIPGVDVALTVSVVRDLEAGEASNEIGAVREKDTVHV